MPVARADITPRSTTEHLCRARAAKLCSISDSSIGVMPHAVKFSRAGGNGALQSMENQSVSGSWDEDEMLLLTMQSRPYIAMSNNQTILKSSTKPKDLNFGSILATILNGDG